MKYSVPFLCCLTDSVYLPPHSLRDTAKRSWRQINRVERNCHPSGAIPARGEWGLVRVRAFHAAHYGHSAGRQPAGKPEVGALATARVALVEPPPCFQWRARAAAGAARHPTAKNLGA